MAPRPQIPEGSSTNTIFEDELEYVESHQHDLEERTLELNIRDVITNLRNLDWSKVVFRNVILFALLHLYSVYGLWLALTSAMWKTLLFCWVLYFLGALGIIMGAHRLWSHKSFKANIPLRAFLAFGQTIAFQNSIYEWSRDHRVHHKYSETDGDPHNANRGLFFAHMGWLMYKKHPDVISKGKRLDMSDLESDPIVRFQRKYYLPLVILCCFVMPTLVPMYFWGESFLNSLMVATILRYCVCLHITWSVNSFAHWIGTKPYDKYIYPVENAAVSFFAMGEGWHNYHHTFPWDYKTAELGGFEHINGMTTIIDFFAAIGWVWERRTASEEMIRQRILRTGDDTKSRQRTIAKTVKFQS